MSTALAVTNPGSIVTFSPEQVELVKRQIMPGASDDELKLFLSTCQRLQLDPFARQIFAVKRWSRERGEKWETQVSIDGFRVVANRSGDYQGQVGPQWCGPDRKWIDIWLGDTPPSASRVGVWRRGFKEPTWGIARWTSFVQKTKDGSPTRAWATMPDIMLAKCAEAQALRKAYPNDLSGVYTRDEMGQSEVLDVQPDETPLVRSTPPPRLPEATAPREVDFPLDTSMEESIKAENIIKEANKEDLHRLVNEVLPGEANKAQRKDIYARFGLRGTNPIRAFLALSVADQQRVLDQCREWHGVMTSELPDLGG